MSNREPHVPVLADLHSLPESERIKVIGRCVVTHQKVVSFIVDDQPKADRYIRLLKEQFPGLLVVGSWPIPGTSGVVGVKVTPASGEAN